MLDSLGAGDRARFEAHLADCERCRSAIAEIAPLLGLMSRVEPERARRLIAPSAEGPGDDGPEPGHRNRVVSMARARGRRRRRRVVAAVAAAAAIAVAVFIVPAVIDRVDDGRRSVVALEPLADLPLTAEVELADVAWGTRVDRSDITAVEIRAVGSGQVLMRSAPRVTGG
ncbi:zf-HC2 domain-containing protein [Microbacterium sp. XT11]|uniref:zf-HC2 domain-containing protein n=1 Tax=Microbacterium sp. XT11 TaxID=367477 RepID=UPI000831930B|nr:zf-HC2 domain-containing protein [Microbacterium sp. XT11]